MTRFRIPKENVLAPVSLLCGVLALTLLPFLAALAAILTGHIAYAKARRLQLPGKLMALGGLVLGYLGLVASVLLFGVWLALPADYSLLGGKEQAAAHAAVSPVRKQKPPVKQDAEAASAVATVPAAALPLLHLTEQVAAKQAEGVPLNEIELQYELSEEEQRYWQRLEVRQGTVIATPRPDQHGMARQIMLLSALNDQQLTWACVGELTPEMQQAVCR